MSRDAMLLCFIALFLMACPSSKILPLIGEEPEIAELLTVEPHEDPGTSAIEALRRLHQALVQGDMALAWTLLANRTRQLLDERGAIIGVSGRELLDSSTLPGLGGTVKKVRYEDIFFGENVTDFVPDNHTSSPNDPVLIRAVSGDGVIVRRTCVHESGGWKFLFTEL